MNASTSTSVMRWRGALVIVSSALRMRGAALPMTGSCGGCQLTKNRDGAGVGKGVAVCVGTGVGVGVNVGVAVGTGVAVSVAVAV
ncbi:MAG: hypothetical protein F4X57_13675 [Chloroflexi bacterium]|nr:hypothetical protein [Chloroflexota bacterium]